MKWIFKLCFLCILFSSCQQSDQTKIENRCQELFETLQAKDFEAFKQVMITESDAMEHLRRMGTKDNRPPEEEVEKQMIEMLSHRKDQFDFFYKDNIPWESAAIDSVNFKSRKLLEVETAKVNVFYHYDGQSCEMNFQYWVKMNNGSWKIGNQPHPSACKK